MSGHGFRVRSPAFPSEPEDRGAGLRIIAALAGIVLLLAIVIRGVPLRSISRPLALGLNPTAPEFSLRRFDGGMLTLSDFRGHAVVLNFWASWCGPCVREAPLLEQVWRTYRTRGLVVIGINVQDRERDARKFLARAGITYPNVHGDVSTYRAYGLTGVPETFFVDREGRIVRKFNGAYFQWSVWQEAIEALLDSR